MTGPRKDYKAGGDRNSEFLPLRIYRGSIVSEDSWRKDSHFRLGEIRATSCFASLIYIIYVSRFILFVLQFST